MGMCVLKLAKLPASWLCLQDPLFGGQAADNVRHGSFTNPTGPPPPYESVITDAASHSLPGTADSTGAGTMHTVPGIGGLGTVPAAAAGNGSAGMHAGDASSAGPVSHFEIAVADPVKQGEGVSAYVSYKVRAGQGNRSSVLWAVDGFLEPWAVLRYDRHTGDAPGSCIAATLVSPTSMPAVQYLRYIEQKLYA